MQNGIFTTSTSRRENASNSLNMVDKYAENSMYSLQEMVSTNDDYILIKKCFEAANLDGVRKANISKVYRVVKRGETSEQKSDNLMLFHGTTCDSSIGIIEEGFKPSNQGIYGPGVYMTENSRLAEMYSMHKRYMNLSNSNVKGGFMFIFLNEILQSEKIEKIEVEKHIKGKTASPRKHQFEKYVIKGTAKKHSVETYEQDSNGRKLRTYAPGKAGTNNYFVCHENFVVPRYLIQF